MPEMEALPVQITRLRVAALRRQRVFPAITPKYRALLLAVTEKNLAAAAKTGWVHTLFDQKKKTKLTACLYVFPSVFEDGSKSWEIRIDLDPHNRRAVNWMRKRIREIKIPLGRGPVRFNLMADYAALIGELSRASLNPHSLITVGLVGQAARVLKRGSVPDEGQIAGRGLVVRPIANLREVREAGRLMKTIFTRSPQFGIFVASPRFIKSEMAKLRQGIGSDADHEGIGFFDRTGKLVGWAMLSFQRSNPLTGGHGALGFSLSPGIQGMGLSKFLYRRFFMEAQKRKVKRFIGSTSNPAILHLNRKFGRRPLAYMISSEKPHFPLSYFRKR